MTRRKSAVALGVAEDERWMDALCEYEAYLRGCGRAEATISLYRDNVSRFYRQKRAKWDDELAAFLEWNGEPQIHSNHRLDSCLRFWRWAAGEGMRRTNPAEGVKRRPQSSMVTPNVDIDDIAKVIDALRMAHKAAPNKWESARNYAYAIFALGTGVRPSEGLRLERRDFDLNARCVVARGETVKTRTSRVIFIPPNRTLLSLLRRLMAAQSKSGIPDSAPLFSDSSGHAIESRTWYHILRKHAVACGVRLRPYDLRHAFITHSLADGANPYDIRDQVGHRNMEMLKRYCHSTPDARRATAARSPLKMIKGI